MDLETHLSSVQSRIRLGIGAELKGRIHRIEYEEIWMEVPLRSVDTCSDREIRHAHHLENRNL